MKNTLFRIHYLRAGLLCCLISPAMALFSKNYELSSPDSRITLNVTVGNDISWNLTLNGKTMIEKSVISMDFDKGVDPGINPVVSKQQTKRISQEIVPGIPTKDSVLQDKCNELELNFKGNYKLIFTALS